MAAFHGVEDPLQVGLFPGIGGPRPSVGGPVLAYGVVFWARGVGADGGKVDEGGHCGRDRRLEDPQASSHIGVPCDDRVPGGLEEPGQMHDGLGAREDGGQIVGYITTWQDRAAGLGHIPNLAVAPSHRNQGLGRTLIEHALSGEEVIIAKAGQPMVRLVPVQADVSPRVGGQWNRRQPESCQEEAQPQRLYQEPDEQRGGWPAFGRDDNAEAHTQLG